MIPVDLVRKCFCRKEKLTYSDCSYRFKIITLIYSYKRPLMRLESSRLLCGNLSGKRNLFHDRDFHRLLGQLCSKARSSCCPNGDENLRAVSEDRSWHQSAGYVIGLQRRCTAASGAGRDRSGNQESLLIADAP